VFAEAKAHAGLVVWSICAETSATANPGHDAQSSDKQVVVGLVLDGEGFPKAHEIFAGIRSDSTTRDPFKGVGFLP